MYACISACAYTYVFVCVSFVRGICFCWYEQSAGVLTKLFCLTHHCFDTQCNDIVRYVSTYIQCQKY